MGIGTGIFLLVVGGILAFGVQDSWETFDLTAIGFICMAAGALGIVLALVMQNKGRRSSSTLVQERHDGGAPPAAPAPGETVVREERRDTGL